MALGGWLNCLSGLRWLWRAPVVGLHGFTARAFEFNLCVNAFE
jgi:hypothetical protein